MNIKKKATVAGFRGCFPGIFKEIEYIVEFGGFFGIIWRISKHQKKYQNGADVSVI